jgi:hypothetical protein
LPFAIEVDQKHILVIVKYWGLFDLNTFEEELAAIDGMGPFDHRYRLLTVFDEHLQVGASTEQLRSVAQQRFKGLRSKQLPFHPKAKRVILAPSDLVFGLARLYGVEVANTDIQHSVVRTITEAAAELGMAAADIDTSFPV